MDYRITPDYPAAGDIPGLIEAAKTDPRAALTLSAVYQCGLGVVPINLAKAKECLEPHISKHPVCAAAYELQLTADLGLVIKPAKTVLGILRKRRAEAVVQLAKRGDHYAQIYAGLLLTFGIIVRKDLVAAARFFRRASGLNERREFNAEVLPWGDPFARSFYAVNINIRTMEAAKMGTSPSQLVEGHNAYHALLRFAADQRVGPAEHNIGDFFSRAEPSPTKRGKSEHECRDSSVSHFMRAAGQGEPSAHKRLIKYLEDARDMEDAGNIAEAFHIYGLMGGEVLLSAAQNYEDDEATQRIVVAQTCKSFLSDKTRNARLKHEVREELEALIRRLEWIVPAMPSEPVQSAQTQLPTILPTARQVIALSEGDKFGDAKSLLRLEQNEYGALPQNLCAELCDPGNHAGGLAAAEKTARSILKLYPRSEFTLNGLARIHLGRAGTTPSSAVRDFRECAVALLRASFVPITGRMAHHEAGYRETLEITQELFETVRDHMRERTLTSNERKTYSPLFTMLARLELLQRGVRDNAIFDEFMNLSHKLDPENPETNYLRIARLVCSEDWDEAGDATRALGDDYDKSNTLWYIGNLKRQYANKIWLYNPELENAEGKLRASTLVQTSEALLAQVFPSLAPPLRAQLGNRMARLEDVGLAS